MFNSVKEFVIDLMNKQRLTTGILEELSEPLDWVDGIGLSCWHSESFGYEIKKIDCTDPSKAVGEIEDKLINLFQSTLDKDGYLVIYICRTNSEVLIDNPVVSLDKIPIFGTTYTRMDIKGYEGKVWVEFDLVEEETNNPA